MMKQMVRRAIARIARKTTRPGVRVLMYHAVDDPVPNDTLSLRVSRQQFLEQMTVLRDDRYSVVPLEAVFSASEDDGRLRVAVTFDDGYTGQRWAASVLRTFGFPATFFVVPRFLDGVQSPEAYWEEWEYLDWDDVAALVEEGFGIGAHSATHLDLTQCGDVQLDAELKGARDFLQARLHTDIVSVSYPFGRHSGRVRRAVERAGYALGCTSRYGLSQSVDDPYAVHRTEVAGRDTLQDFVWKLTGKYDWLAHWQDRAPTR
jgi:peptidoglycan/xylan/chitin deacetylase (PgdA/CDA1 family)